MPASIQVLGLGELQSAFARIRTEMPAEVAAASDEAGHIVADEQKSLAPVGPHQGGGNVTPIVDSFKVTPAGSNIIVTAGGASSPHAIVYEFGGTIARAGHGRGGRTYRSGRKFRGTNVTHIKRHPYFYEVVETKATAVEEVFRKMLDRLAGLFSR